MEQLAQIGYNDATMPRTPTFDLKPLTGLAEIEFPTLCRTIREEAGLTQVQMAQAIGLSPTGYGDLERGRCEPGAKTFIYILAIRARSRGVNLKAFFDSKQR